MYSSIFLTGFRATGKTTVGQALAQKLGWRFVDSDAVISERAGMTINELTKKGTDWKLFRQMEVDLLKEMLSQQNIVFSMGGGGCVNDIPHEMSGKTFGEIGKDMLKQAENILVVLLTAPEAVVSDRIREAESQSEETIRPMLDSSQMQAGDKSQIINDIILNSLKVWRERQSLYAQLTDTIIDTGKLSLEECVEKIVDELK